MSVRNGFVLLLAMSTLLFLASCGSSSPTAVAPPTGGFSASTLNGTYVFSTVGTNVDGYLMTIAGALAANGSSGISGTVDIISPDPNVGVIGNQSISNGSYKVGADGRGQILFAAASANFELDFVLSSNSHGLITEFDGNGSGSGTIDLQTATTQPSGSFIFSLSGTGASNTASFGTIGSMTLGSGGAVSAGFQDFNSGGSATVDQAISTSSSVTVGTGTTPGTASLVSPLGAFSFDVYQVDATHLKLVETDGSFFTSGDVFTQATTLPTSATLAFTMSGADLSGNPLGLGGFIPLDSNSNILSGVEEDFNDGGTIGQDTSFGGGFSAITGGRSVLSVTGFQNGSVNDIPGSYEFAAYPFTSNGVTGVALLEIDGLGISSGTAYVQTGTDFAASQGYGLNVSAFNLAGGFEEDDIAEFTTTSSSFTGIEDVNDGPTVAVSPNQTFSGSYTPGSAGLYTVTVNSNSHEDLFNFNLYAVNDSTFLVLETDSTTGSDQVGTGVLELQNSSATPGGEPGISHPLARPGAHFALRHR